MRIFTRQPPFPVSGQLTLLHILHRLQLLKATLPSPPSRCRLHFGNRLTLTSLVSRRCVLCCWLLPHMFVSAAFLLLLNVTWLGVVLQPQTRSLVWYGPSGTLLQREVDLRGITCLLRSNLGHAVVIFQPRWSSWQTFRVMLMAGCPSKMAGHGGAILITGWIWIYRVE